MRKFLVNYGIIILFYVTIVLGTIFLLGGE